MFFGEQLVRNIILLCCGGIASYFTLDQFIEYFKNEDSSVLSYHKHLFDSNSKHQYPTYSICFKRGCFYDPFDSDLKDLMMFTRCDTDGCEMFENLPMKKSLEFPKMQCYSSYFESGTEVKEFESLSDTVMISVSKLLELKISLIVYVHRGGQLMRHLLTTNSPATSEFPFWELSKLFVVNNKTQIGEITFSIGNVVILRKREDGIQKCNASLMNEDQKWREIVVEKIGCIPWYWNSFFPTYSNDKIYTNCTKKQLSLLAEHETNPHVFKNTTKLYTNPCDEMESQIQIDRKFYPNWSNKMVASLKFKYASARYLEILNYKAYTGESLLGQVGGYIGTQKCNL